jgi:hypothetical protein
MGMFGFSFTVTDEETKENLFKNRFVYSSFASIFVGVL